MIAQAAICEDFVAALAAKAAAVEARATRPRAEDFCIPPLNNANQMANVAGLVSRVPSSARVLCGGAPGRRGLLLPAHRGRGRHAGRRDRPDRDLRAGDHRAVVHREAEAVRGANGTAVRAGVERVDRRPSHARSGCPRAMDFGCVWINCHIPLVAEMPHGGFKESRLRQGPVGYSLEDYTRVKHVMSKYA